MNAKIVKAINQGIIFLANQQRKDGSFLSFSSSNPKSFAKAQKHQTIFPTFLVLSCLLSLEETPRTKIIKQKAAKFLLSQKAKHWSFNYWARNSPETKKLPYPDDLDDTFCALSSLYQFNPELIDGSAMAKIVTLLTAAEEKEGGPYRTWLVPPEADEIWRDVDLVANSNIAYFLSLQGISLSNINTLIDSAIETENYTSPYYSSIYPVIYFISRFYTGGKRKKMEDFLLSKRGTNGEWENLQNTALAVSSLLNLGVAPSVLKKSVEYLIKRQGESWDKSYQFIVELIRRKKKYYAGSPAVTTAFCLEALAKYNQKTQEQKDIKRIKRKGEKADSELKKIYSLVVRRAQRRFSLLKGELKKQAFGQLEKTLRIDKDRQIILMPYFFKISLGRKGEIIPHDWLIKLGLASLYGWIAYTIYDDFLDDEGNPKLLSVANVCLRESTTIYNHLLPYKTGFSVFLHKIVDRIDAANTWEVSHCRAKIKNEKLTRPRPSRDEVGKMKNFTIPNYGDFSRLAERSLGHALGPIAILFSLGLKEKSAEVKNLMKFFQHFLAARQLNDDAHDWEKDFKMGHINAAGAEILKKVQSSKSKVRNYYQLQQIFWSSLAVDVCQTVIKHTQLARKALEKVSLICNLSLFEKLLTPIENSAQKALKEREETLKFLQAYTA